MTIRQFQKKHLQEMVKLYSQSYTTPKKKVSMKMALWTINYCLKISPEFCFEAVSNSGECLGAIFCRRDSSYLDPVYYIESVQVRDKSKGKGIGSILVASVIKKAKQVGAKTIYIDFDSRTQHLAKWYLGFGFKPAKRSVYDLEIRKKEAPMASQQWLDFTRRKSAWKPRSHHPATAPK